MSSEDQIPSQKVDNLVRTLRELVSWAKEEKNNERERKD